MTRRLASLLGLAASAVGLGGCAHEALGPGFPQNANGWVVPANYSWPPATVASARAASQHTGVVGTFGPSTTKTADTAASSIFAKTLGDVPRPRARNELRSVLPGSSECLARLSALGVRFHTLDHEMGVKTPISVDAPIAGIRYYTGANGPFLADCRLVLALTLVAPELSAFGVSDVRFSGAYVYRLSNKGRVSLHAYGLAIDMHGFTRLGVRYEVQHDFKKGIGGSLSDETPITNAIAVRFRNSGLFHEYLTPDDNRDHYDHVHVGVSPLPDEVL
ncbi:MAG: extensin family protein [Pseudomonadota bacterium]